MNDCLSLLGLPNLPTPTARGAPIPAPDETDVRKLAKEYTKYAVNTLVEIAQYGKSESARVAAANVLLERGHGKVPQGAIEVGEGLNKIRVEWV